MPRGPDTGQFTCYLVTNTINGKQYIGITSRKFTQRWTEHQWAAKRSKKSVFGQAITKYGAESFTVTSLATAASREEAWDLERKYIAEYNTYGKGGYNSTIGGDGGSGAKLTEEQKALRRCRKHSSESIEKMRLAQLGKKKSPEHVEQIRARMIGKVRPQTAEERTKRAVSVKASWHKSKPRTLSKEGLARQREAGIKRFQENPDWFAKGRSEEAKEKRRLTMTGRVNGPLPLSTRQKLAAAQKAHAAQMTDDQRRQKSEWAAGRIEHLRLMSEKSRLVPMDVKARSASIAGKAAWADPQKRVAFAEEMRSGPRAEENRRNLLEGVKRRWADPEKREKHAAAMREMWAANPGKFAAAAEKNRARWQRYREEKNKCNISQTGAGSSAALPSI